MPDTDGELKPLNFKAICPWNDKDINTAFYDSGFEFIDSARQKTHFFREPVLPRLVISGLIINTGAIFPAAASKMIIISIYGVCR
ncbi:MAG: hypothetical protein KZQ66_21225, partial [Candidatus Thiodiazotropha sp. (ex Lucinoma aequizonata)]|nr:hypothetical protein [Candidatus Thiodiazotropha sp. (ex Lucinoma aequizonata)]MCU7887533.1 hypothetical protein [Candidatus Thiodiazotropha sp. (ex Lucinoma aequizonata)]MCU7894858.1 hypothetical protein [Candidatus Thiodiazotropha sp. (ex Lucinoma aequizonata)]MCU7904185.1 hypothetical protein [Candidatus Thiodiazotropha sp. (ex Lucinoma aequizonata)]MCU7907502.1 hypothetical protein [Candidatus Thiodiazotropha sp. (ex Lucinoma aequizonata)]